LKMEAKTHRVIEASDELIELWPDRVGENSDVKAIVAKREVEVGEAFKLVVATATAAFERGSPERESGLGSWMADCYKDWAGVDVAIQNGGGMRADIAAGPVTLRTLFNVMPFDNTLVKLRMKGEFVRAALDHGAGLGRLAQVSGVSMAFDRTRSPGRRLSEVRVAGQALDDAQVYSVATLDFLVEGGDGFTDFARAESSASTGVLVRDVLRACAQKQKTLAPPAPGRLRAMER
jgi:2',3'-cyclic-nucleotide 2'-phosphodiesterase (5'-nucleotidase family)